MTRRVVRGLRPRQAERGTTLLELTVALAAVSVLLVALVLTWRQSVVAYVQGSETADLQQEARIAYDRMMKELRLAGMNACPQPGMTGAVTAAASNSITVQYFSPAPNWGDASNLVRCPPPVPTAPNFAPQLQTVIYAHDGGAQAITRDPGTGATALTGSTIQSLTFQYSDCAGASIPLTSIDEPAEQPARDGIARVTITVVAGETLNGQPLTRQLVASVRLRGTACAGTS